MLLGVAMVLLGGCYCVAMGVTWMLGVDMVLVSFAMVLLWCC